MMQQDERTRRDESRRPARRSTRAALALAAAAALLPALPARAVILADSATRNTAAPGDSAASAWNLQGQFGNFLATPIAPNLFIAAKHIGYNGAGNTLTLGGQSYTTTASYDVGNSDLRVFQIDTAGGTHTFGSYATLYDAGASGAETGKPLFVAGRGSQRGAAYAPNGTTVGWTWSADDHAQSWGESSVSGIATDAARGDFVTFDFTNPGGIGLSGGDSSGGLFVQANGQWRLAGVNYGVDSGWSTTAAGPYTNADVFDARGLYVGGPNDGNPANDPDNVFVPNGPVPVAGQSYASRISSNRDGINAIFLTTGNAALVPEPTTLATVVAGIALALRRRR